MEKLTITNLVDFNRKSEKGRLTMINNLKAPKVKGADDSGGHYWISALTCLANAFVEDAEQVLNTKIDQLIGEIETKEHKVTKDRWQRNINILQDFEEFDFSQLRPSVKLTYLTKPKDKSIIPLNGLPLFAKPHHVYTYEEDNIKKVGAVWFVIKSTGFRHDELAMIVDLLYRYLHTNYSAEYEVSSDYCLVVDANTTIQYPYSKIETGQITSPLISIINEMKELL